MLEEIGRNFANLRLVALRQAELLRELAAAHETTVTIPQLTGDVVDLAGLVEIGRHALSGAEH